MRLFKGNMAGRALLGLVAMAAAASFAPAAMSASAATSSPAASFAPAAMSAAPAAMSASAAQQQEDKRPSPEELAEKEAARLETMLKLEDWQVFYVDSVLRHDYSELMKEIDGMSRARVENSDLYMAANDKWMETIQAAYKKFFTPEQWKVYLKQEGDKIIRDREKRRAKAAGLDLKERDKKKLKKK